MVTVAGFFGRALGQGWGCKGVVLGSEEGGTCRHITLEEGQSSTWDMGGGCRILNLGVKR